MVPGAAVRWTHVAGDWASELLAMVLDELATLILDDRMPELLGRRNDEVSDENADRRQDGQRQTDVELDLAVQFGFVLHLTLLSPAGLLCDPAPDPMSDRLEQVAE